MSHSVWSAWIEILRQRPASRLKDVALRLECVDRNTSKQTNIRRYIVALRLECVDRNCNLLTQYVFACSRTPFGVRG